MHPQSTPSDRKVRRNTLLPVRPHPEAAAIRIVEYDDSYAIYSVPEHNLLLWSYFPVNND